MSVPNNILIPPTTAAITSDSFTAIPYRNVGLVCADLSAGEIVNVQIYADAANPPKWIDFKIAGLVQQFNSDNPVITLWDDTLTYRIVKPITTNAVGVSLNIPAKF